MRIKKKLLVIAITTALVTGNVSASGDEFQRLEDKINTLESMLMSLKAELAEKDKSEQKAKADAKMEVDKNTQDLAVIKSKEKEKQTTQNNYKFGGFIKATGSLSAYSDGDLAAGSAGRDFYIPGTVPVGGDGESTDFDFGAKESRINFKSNHVLASGDKLSTFIEMDFLGGGGNEVVSKSAH